MDISGVTGAAVKASGRLHHRAQAWRESFPVPTVPLTQPWQLGVSDLVQGSSRFPARLGRLIGLLDHLGEVELSPESVGFDGENVAWTDVVEIKLGPAVDVVSVSVIERELERVVSRFPPVPGRSWLIRRVLEVVLGLTLALTQANTSPPDQSA